MSGETMDRKLNDYLDGRLSEDERREFESRLARDPRLADRLAAYRELGEALRDAHREVPVDLPPGFHARARARFEATRRSRLTWSRLLSWEATGLAAAVVLLAAILLPVLLERPDLDTLRPSPPTGPRAPVTPAPGPVAKEPGPRQEIADSRAGDHAGDTASGDRTRADSPAAGPVGGRSETTSEEAGSKAFASPPTMERQPSRMAPSRDAPPEADADSRLDATGSLARRAPEEPAPTELRRARPAAPQPAPAEEPERRQKADLRTEDALRAPETAPSAPVEAVEKEGFARAPSNERPVQPLDSGTIAPGALAPGEVLVIDTAAAWRRAGASSSGAWTDTLRPDFARERVVAIGPRERPVDCASAVLLERADRIVIVLAAVDDASAATGGCALVLPAGDRPVDVVVRAGEDR